MRTIPHSRIVVALLTILVPTACVGRERHRHEVYVVERPGPPTEVIVVEQPPPERVEAIPVPPSPNHIWVPGYWVRHGNAWVWVEGCHVERPRQTARWEPGHWNRRPGGWVWIPGHWV